MSGYWKFRHTSERFICDPDHDEMLAFLATQTCGEELDPFDAESAIYWFSNDYHGGQASNLYSALSTSEYRPGPIANGPEPDSFESYLYGALVSEYVK